MAIPASTVVNVSISTSPQFPSRRGFGVLNILGTTPDIIQPVERIRFYSSILEVAADFAEGTPEHAMATTYFSQQPKPIQCAISMQYLTAQAGQALSGGNVETTIATWNLIVDGSFSITIDGITADVLLMDFSGDTTQSDLGLTIETAINAADLSAGFANAIVEFFNGQVIITSGTTGITSTVSFLSAAATGTPITSLLDMAQGVATLQTGIAAEADPVDALAPILAKSTDWYGLALDNIYSAAQITAVATSVEALVNVMCYSSQDVTILNAATTTDIASVLKALGLRRTFGMYNPNPSEYPHVSAFARAFTVDFGGTDTTITLKFKQLPGVTALNLNTTQKSATQDKNINVYTVIGDVSMVAEGVMANGTYFDEVHGVDWLSNAIENNVFGYLATRTTKVPLTDKGGAALEQQVTRALDEGVQNGLLAPGTTIDGIFLGVGYSVTVEPVADIPQANKDARIGPTITFIALLAGAIHTIQINGTLER